MLNTILTDPKLSAVPQAKSMSKVVDSLGRTAVRYGKLAENLLDLVKMFYGLLTLNKASVNLSQLMGEEITELASGANRAKCRLDLQIESEIKIYCNA